MKEIKPKFIPERKIDVIETFIKLKTVGMLQDLCLAHLRQIKTIKHPDPDLLKQLFQDYLVSIISNNAYRDTLMAEYKES